MICKKVSFADESSANFYIHKLKRTSERKTVPIRAYLCPNCNCWHLTSQETKDIEMLNRQIKNLKAKVEHYKRENEILKNKLNKRK